MNIISKIQNFFFIRLRIIKYQFLSKNKTTGSKLILTYPVLFSGKGKIVIKDKIKFGYSQSPHFFNTYGYIEARTQNSEIVIGKNVVINNNFSIVALNRIEIQDNCIIGVNFSVMDSNFHHLEPTKRNHPNPVSQPVLIGKNVFIGNNVTVLKGVIIGENSVIGSNSLVTHTVPNNVVVSGNPAQIIKKI
ncbi:acyltransferase [Flavobacterium sp.]|uniref:acyltransferase n=1 Tax=Flavobacterium sp. TaxID=239 RepID=UPI003528FFCE